MIVQSFYLGRSLISKRLTKIRTNINNYIHLATQNWWISGADVVANLSKIASIIWMKLTYPKSYTERVLLCLLNSLLNTYTKKFFIPIYRGTIIRFRLPFAYDFCEAQNTKLNFETVSSRNYEFCFSLCEGNITPRVKAVLNFAWLWSVSRVKNKNQQTKQVKYLDNHYYS